jgi:hypothetical protein
MEERDSQIKSMKIRKKSSRKKKFTPDYNFSCAFSLSSRRTKFSLSKTLSKCPTPLFFSFPLYKEQNELKNAQKLLADL